MDIKEIKKRAREQIRPYIRNFVPVILIFILIRCSIDTPNSILKYLARKHPGDFGSISNIFNIVSALINAFITPILTMAFLCLIAKIAKKKDDEQMPEISFKAFLSHFNMAGRAILNDLYTGLWLFIWALPIVLIYIFLGIGFSSVFSATISVVIFVIVLMAVILYKYLSYYLNSYAIADDNETEVIEAMKISKTITKGHIGELLLLDLSFIGWGLLSTLTLGIALIWVMPYMELSHFYAYQELVKASDSADVQPFEE